MGGKNVKDNDNKWMHPQEVSDSFIMINYVRNERDGFKSELSMPVGRSKGPKWSQWIHTYSWG